MTAAPWPADGQRGSRRDISSASLGYKLKPPADYHGTKASIDKAGDIRKSMQPLFPCSASLTPGGLGR